MSPVVSLQAATLDNLDPRIVVPTYDRTALVAGIVHIGVGGFHRAHLATYADELAAAGHRDWAIAGSGVMAADAGMARVLGAQDGLYTLVTRGEAETKAQVIGSIVDYILAAGDIEPLVARIADPATRIVSLTVTEGGYPVDEDARVYDPARAPAGRDSAFGVIVAALRRRRDTGVGPITVMSCDNVIENGSVARLAVLGVAEELDPVLARWIDENVTFPNAMVDRITPATTDADRAYLADEYGLEDGWPVITEPFRQWVIEDSFVAGRPPWEDLDITVTGDVEPYELMKLRLLNAGHSTMAYLAALAGVEYVDEAMAEPLLRGFLGSFLEKEAGPVLPNIPGIDVPAYEAKLVERFSNPAIGDQISRLCLDGSAKFPKFLMPTIRNQLRAGGPIGLSALALAGWCSYLVGVADDGSEIRLASDPDLENARSVARQSLANPEHFLTYARVFGDDLVQDARFRTAFVGSLNELRSRGVRATLSSVLNVT
ncbi:MAG: mannitol dehydrogenase family protein [Acidimicrobiia bacterium]